MQGLGGLVVCQMREGDAVPCRAVELESGPLDLRVGDRAGDPEVAALRGGQADEQVRDPGSVHVGRFDSGVQAAGDEERTKGDVPRPTRSGGEGVGNGEEFG